MGVLYTFVWLLSAAAAPSSWCAETQSPPADLYRESSRCVLEARYEDAERVLDRFILDAPDDPAGYLLKAAVLQYECTDYEDFSRDAEYETLLSRTEELALRRIAVNSPQIMRCIIRGPRYSRGGTCVSALWARYYLSSAKSLRGVRTVSRGSFLGGIADGRAGAKGMSSILAEAPGFCDAYLGTGSYRFWKTVAAGPLRWIPFVHDDREKGIGDVRKALECGKLTGPLTNTVLLEMLLEYDPDAARELGERMVNAYPSCRLFAWQLGEAYKKLGRYNSAVALFTGLAERYACDTRDDGSGQVRCWWKLAVLSRDLGKRSDCRAYCGKILELGRRGTVMKRQKARIEKARRWYGELGNGEERTRPGRGQ